MNDEFKQTRPVTNNAKRPNKSHISRKIRKGKNNYARQKVYERKRVSKEESNKFENKHRIAKIIKTKIKNYITTAIKGTWKQKQNMAHELLLGNTGRVLSPIGTAEYFDRGRIESHSDISHVVKQMQSIE